MPVSKIRGVNINWQVIGEGGPWVALITGGRRGHDELVPLARRLAGYGYRVLLHDRRNTGASDIRIAGDEGEEAIWTDDLYELMSQQRALPAFIGGGSSGARTSILFYLRHPQAVRGLLLLRVTGGAFAAGRLPENYYGQFIRAAEQGGMAAICAMDPWKERVAANPANGPYLRDLPVQTFIDVLTKWRDIFVAGAHLPVMGVTEAELASIKVPTIVIPGNDKTHSSESGLAAHRLIPGCTLHRLAIEDQEVPLIPFPEWSPHEEEIARIFADFLRRTISAEGRAEARRAMSEPPSDIGAKAGSPV
jgi:pimeloyl-ACP methyl ester carboxylesterase